VRHLPSVRIPDRPSKEPHPVIQQDKNGDPFLVSAQPLHWAEVEAGEDLQGPCGP
jgi:hypothetical protein